MGKLRFYTGGKYGLLNITDFSLNQASVTKKLFPVAWKGTDGSSHTAVGCAYNESMFYGIMQPTAETIETFDESNNTLTAISGVTLTVNSAGDSVNSADGKIYRTISVSLQNTNGTAVTVPSVTLKKNFPYSTSSSSEGLSWVYIFDTPITLAAGETKTVVFNFGYTLPTNDD